MVKNLRRIKNDKKIKTNIMNIWRKFKYFFKRNTDPFPYPGGQPDKSKEKLTWAMADKPENFEAHCPICGLELTVGNIKEKHYMKDYVVLIYYCSKCNLQIQKRFTHNFDAIELTV